MVEQWNIGFERQLRSCLRLSQLRWESRTQPSL